MQSMIPWHGAPGVNTSPTRQQQPADLASIHQPVLVMNGESDRMVPTKNTVDLDRRLPNSQLVVYPDAGHGGVFQFHEDFVTRALELLREGGRP
jgi:pimeloyl-ACP methyl ester carboxylesterase